MNVTKMHLIYLFIGIVLHSVEKLNNIPMLKQRINHVNGILNGYEKHENIPMLNNVDMQVYVISFFCLR